MISWRRKVLISWPCLMATERWTLLTISELCCCWNQHRKICLLFAAPIMSDKLYFVARRRGNVTFSVVFLSLSLVCSRSSSRRAAFWFSQQDQFDWKKIKMLLPIIFILQCSNSTSALLDLLLSCSSSTSLDAVFLSLILTTTSSDEIKTSTVTSRRQCVAWPAILAEGGNKGYFLSLFFFSKASASLSTNTQLHERSFSSQRWSNTFEHYRLHEQLC